MKQLIQCVLILLPLFGSAQQYNSDSWISKPEGTITIIPTVGSATACS